MNIKTLQEYAKDSLNVLLVGDHGVGKTEIIKSVFGKQFGQLNKDWLYFSGSTLDPWVDFIGIPKNYTREDGKEVFGIIPNERFTGEEPIKAIFIDELNRSDEKVQNAIMELIQFGSINGRKFKHLKCIWGAINPFDDESEDPYSVQKLDPAQEDRFHVKINVPNKLNKEYLYSKYGKEAVDIFDEWRKNNNYEKLISPRRIDYMLSAYSKNYNLKDFVDEKINNVFINVNELDNSLKAISKGKEIEAIIKEGHEAIKAYFTLEQISSLSSYITCNKKLALSICLNVDEEISKKVELMLNSNPKILDYVIKEKNKIKLKEINKYLNKNQLKFIKEVSKEKIDVSFFSKRFSNFIDDFYNTFDVENISEILDIAGLEIFNFDKNMSISSNDVKMFINDIEDEINKIDDFKYYYFIKCLYYTLQNNRENDFIKEFSKKLCNISSLANIFNLNVSGCRGIIKGNSKIDFDEISSYIYK